MPSLTLGTGQGKMYVVAFLEAVRKVCVDHLHHHTLFCRAGNVPPMELVEVFCRTAAIRG